LYSLAFFVRVLPERELKYISFTDGAMGNWTSIIIS
jgi:hypothetical protein